MVSVKVYTVVTVGLTDGLELVELKPDGALDQEYVSPETVASPIEMGVPGQMAVLAIMDAPGNGFTKSTSMAVSLLVDESVIPFGFEVHALMVSFPLKKL